VARQQRGFDLIGDDDALVSTPYAEGKVDAAWFFPGSSGQPVWAEPDYFQNLAPGQSFTLEFWMKQTVNQDRGLLSWRDASNSVLSSVRTGSSGASILWQLNPSVTVESAALAKHLEWNHISLVWDGTQKRASIYINGVLAASQPYPTIAMPSVKGLFVIGNGSNSTFIGHLDEVTLHDTVLDQAELLDIVLADGLGKSSPLGNQPPLVDAGPDRQLAGASASLTLQGRVADDSAPENITVRWTQLSGPPGGAVLSDPGRLDPTATFNQLGWYDFQITAEDGFYASQDSVSISVGLPPSQPDLSGDLLSWWPGNSSNRDIISGHDGVSRAGFAEAKVGQGWQLRGPGSRDFLVLPKQAFQPLAPVGSAFTLEFWVKAEAGADRWLMGWRNPETKSLTSTVRLGNSSTSVVWTPVGDTIPRMTAGQWNHVALVWDPDASLASIYINGTLSGSKTATEVNSQIQGELVIGEVNHQYFQGGMDEISLYRRALTGAEIQSIVAGGASGKTFPGNPQTLQVTATHPDLAVVAGPVELNALALAQPGASLSYFWSFVSGPQPVVFADPTLPHQSFAFPVAGTYILRLTLTDGAFSRSEDFRILVRNPVNQAPLAEAGPNQAVNLFEGITLAGSVTDDGVPTNGALFSQWIQVSGPGQAVFDDATEPTSSVNFTEPGTYVLRLTASDGELSGEDEVTLNVQRGPQVVHLTTSTGDTRFSLEDTVTLLARPADPLFAPQSVEFFARGISIGFGQFSPEDNAFRLTVPAATLESGSLTVVAVMTGPGSAGLITGSLILDIFDPVVENGPLVQINAQALLAQLEARFEIPDEVREVIQIGLVEGVIARPVQLVATVRDDNLKDYRVEIAPLEIVDLDNPQARDPAFRLLATGSQNVENTVVATVDPATLANGTYALRVIAEGLDGLINLQTAIVTVDSGYKPGRVTYAVNDLNMPLAGIPVQITRIYDSLEADRSGDLGYGWKMAFKEGRLKESVPRESVEDLIGIFGARSFRVGDRVTVTTPDGRRVGFTFVPALQDSAFGAGAGLFGTVFKPHFLPDPGVYEKLEVDNVSIGLSGMGKATLYLFNLPYNPSEYRLITQEGLTYRFSDNGSSVGSQAGDLIDIQDRVGNRLEYRKDGIFSSTGAQITFTRDSQDRITRIDFPLAAPELPSGGGRAFIRYQYDANGDLVQVTDPAGLFTRFTYYNTQNSTFKIQHYLQSILDPSGNPLAIQTYDGQGRLETVTDALGKVTTIAYGESQISNLKFEIRTNPLGGVVRTEYDARGNIVRTVNEIGAISSTEYDDNDNPIRVTAADGGITTRTFDAQGNVLSETNALGHRTSRTYDSFSNILTETDPRGFTTRFAYDAFGLLTRVTDPQNAVTQMERDDYGRVLKVVDPLGRATRFEYETDESDPLKPSKPTRITYPDGNSIRFTYNGFAQPTSYTDESGATQQLVSDEAGKLLKKIDPLGKETTYSYNDRGELESVTNSLNQTTTMAYDLAGRLIEREDPNGGVTTFEYDDLGRLAKTWDPLNRLTQKTYRADGTVASIIDPEGDAVLMEHDALGRRTALTDPANNRTEFVYNQIGQTTETTDPLGKVTRYLYDPSGNLAQITDRLGRKRVFQYDGNNRLTRETWLSAQSDPVADYSLRYDPVGNLLEVTPSSIIPDPSSLIFNYDLRNRILRTDDGRGLVLHHAYDPVNRRDTVYEPDGTSRTATRDARGLLAELDWQGGLLNSARVEFQRNDLGDVTEVLRYNSAVASSNPITTHLTFGRASEDVGALALAYTSNGDTSPLQALAMTKAMGSLQIEPDASELLMPGSMPMQRITQITHSITSSPHPLITSDYTHDDAGQLLSDSTSSPHPYITSSRSYSHDPRGQLISVASSAPALAEQFDYDSSGNRETSQSGTEPARSYTTGPSNRVLSDGTWSYVYDDEGNLVRKDSITQSPNRSITYSFDHRNRLIRVDESSGSSLLTSVSYAYDFLDRRIQKAVHSITSSPHHSITSFHYSGEMIWKEVRETESQPAATLWYLNGEHIDQWQARQVRSPSQLGYSTLHWFAADRQGSVQAVLDSAGNIQEAYAYSAYGVGAAPENHSVCRVSLTG